MRTGMPNRNVEISTARARVGRSPGISGATERCYPSTFVLRKAARRAVVYVFNKTAKTQRASCLLPILDLLADGFERGRSDDFRFGLGLYNHFPKHAVPPHQDAGDRQDRRSQSENDP